MRRAIALLALAPITAAAAQYFCVAPPVPCQSLTLMTSWQFVPESAAPHWLHVVANGREYGRLANGTYFGVPNSQMVPDQIFSAGFGP